MPSQSVFGNKRERVIEQDATIRLFNLIVEQADEQQLLSGKHFIVDGSLIRSWSGPKSFARKGVQGSNDDGESRTDNSEGRSFKGQKRSNAMQRTLPSAVATPGGTAKAKRPASCATWVAH